MRPSLDDDAARRAFSLRDADATFEEISEALTWIDQAPEHRAAFDRVERFLAACDNVMADPEQAELLPPAMLAENDGNRLWHRPMMIAASFAALFAGLVTLFLAIHSFQPPAKIAQARYASAVGEVRKVSLPDGSYVTLSGASAISISFDKGKRRVALTDGEALFKVAHDADRPFIVDTGSGSTTAIGTAFNIHRDIRGATVTVVEGTVEVVARGRDFQSRARLGSAMQVQYFQDGAMGALERVDPLTALSWQKGELYFRGQPLMAVLADLNRYSPRPIILDDPQIGMLPVTGTVKAEGIVEWLEGLASVTGVEVIRSDGEIRLIRHSGHRGTVPSRPVSETTI